MSCGRALRHAPQSVTSLGKQSRDNVPDAATSIATRMLPDPSMVDIQRPCGHDDDHRESDTICPAQTVEEHAQRYLLEARARSKDKRLFEPPSSEHISNAFVVSTQQCWR